MKMLMVSTYLQAKQILLQISWIIHMSIDYVPMAAIELNSSEAAPEEQIIAMNSTDSEIAPESHHSNSKKNN